MHPMLVLLLLVDISAVLSILVLERKVVIVDAALSTLMLVLGTVVVLKDRSKPWQGTARANSYVFHGGKYRNWDEVSTANAVEAVRRGESVCRAAELYSVPRSMLSDIQLCCTANRFPTSHCFYSICHAHAHPSSCTFRHETRRN